MASHEEPDIGTLGNADTLIKDAKNWISAYSTTVETEANKPYVDFIKSKILQKYVFKKEMEKCRLAAMKTRSDERKVQTQLATVLKS